MVERTMICDTCGSSQVVEHVGSTWVALKIYDPWEALSGTSGTAYYDFCKMDCLKAWFAKTQMN